jgi:hypothetical protein
MNFVRIGVRLAIFALLCFACARGLRAQQSLDADVVVLDDTSGSMKENDPKNAVVLVTRLFADIVPGKLAAVRLLNLNQDGKGLDQQDTGNSKPCPDAPGQMCHIMNLPADAVDRAVRQHMLIDSRDSRGDPAFKERLRNLLQPAAPDTVYQYSFATIEKRFEENASPPETPRFVVWLSDGAPDVDANDWEQDRNYLKKLLDNGVSVRALVFKSGKTERVEQAGIKPNLVDGTPSDLMRAFADVFRQIVQAPYAEDGVVASKPEFTIKPRMEDAWIVIYGDESLSSASVSTGGQTVQADYASDHYNGAAYRVAYIKNPPAGSWTVHVNGGGAGASYAVIQRSTLTPFVYPVADVIPGVPFKLVASARSGQGGTDLLPSDLPEPVIFDATLDGQTVRLNDDGQNGDEAKGDGRYTTMLTARRTGPITVLVRAHNSFMDRTIKVEINARGVFRYNGGPVSIDFGSLKAGGTVCRNLDMQAEQQGMIPFELRSVASLPRDLRLEFRANGKRVTAGAGSIPAMPQDQKQICLVTGRDAASSESHAQSWVSLAVSGRQDSEAMVELRMNWTVRSLTFWERWGWLILLILAILLVWFIIYGYIKPYRFPAGLALCYAPAMDELDDQTPQPVRLWRGVGIGFYRDARACLHADFRVNGQVRGAVAILVAGPRRAVIVKAGSRALYREVGVDEWDPMPPAGRRTGQGEIYRVGETGPYFRISTRMTT